MLYETLNQPLIITAIFFTGILCALFFDFASLVYYLCNKNKVVKQIADFFAAILSFFILFLVNLSVNFGKFRIYIILVFLIGFTIQRFTIGKLWTKFLEKCYIKNKERKKALLETEKHGEEG